MDQHKGVSGTVLPPHSRRALGLSWNPHTNKHTPLWCPPEPPHMGQGWQPAPGRWPWHLQPQGRAGCPGRPPEEYSAPAALPGSKHPQLKDSPSQIQLMCTLYFLTFNFKEPVQPSSASLKVLTAPGIPGQERHSFVTHGMTNSPLCPLSAWGGSSHHSPGQQTRHLCLAGR